MQKEDMLTPEELTRAVSFCKAIADETRMRILYALSKQELCVGDLAAALSMTTSAVSHQLAILKQEGQVKARRAGKNMFYSLDDEHVVDILNETLEHVRHKMKE